MKNAEFIRVAFENLILDPQNPRLPKSMGNKSEKEIINFFLSDASLIELMLAIGKNDFFEGEQLLVVSEGDKYLVIEGNRRLSAVKLLHNPEIADIYKTHMCPLAKVLRKELKSRNVKKLLTVFSEEQPLKPVITLSSESKKVVPGSTGFVPSVAGLIMASKVISDLLDI